MKYKLDSLNVKDSDYIFVSKNNREYEIGELLGISYDLDNKRTYDIVAIYDFDAPDLDSPNNTVVELVGWFFGCNFSSNKIKETEQTIREYVDEYENKIFVKEEKEMINYKIINENIYGECSGSIYMGIIKEATKIFLDAEKLKDFSNDLWQKLMRELTKENPIYIGLGETNYSFNPNTADNNIIYWYRVYEDGDQYADKIEIVDGEILEKNTCINAAYNIMLKEIQENMTDCRFVTDAIIKMYNGLEHYNGVRYFYIIDEEHSTFVTNNDNLDKWNIKYKFIDNNSGDITIKKYVNKKEN